MVSIIIPTFNRAHKIRRPLNSILEQTYKDWEAIIVDDFSTDETEKVVNNYNIPSLKYIKLPKNCGPSVARNIGMRYASGEYSTFLDSDDIWSKSFLESLVGLLDENPEFGLAYCDSTIYDLNQKPYYTFVFEPYSFPELLSSHGKIPTGAFVFRTNGWHHAGEFNKEMLRGEDFEWQLRFGELYDFIRYPHILHHYFRDKDGLMHTTNSDRAKLMASSKILSSTKASIKRRKC